MRRKLKEQINYGNTPERMDPNLERKLASPDSLYATNPAMKKGAADVQRLVSDRFQKVTDKLRQVTGIQDLSSKQVQKMLYKDMMRKLPDIMRIEAAHKDELIELAIQSSLDEGEVPEGRYQIEANLGMPDNGNFRMEPEDEEDEEDEEEDKEEKLKFPSFDLDELTDEEILELEKHKRNIINALIQGAAKKVHYIFQKPEVKSRLDAIDPSLYRDYLGIMAITDFLYFNFEDAIEHMAQTAQGIAGKVELDDADEEEGEEGEEQPDTKIIATGIFFPILCHEIIKGLEEAKGRAGLPSDSNLRAKVLGQTDVLSNEPMQLRIGPEIVEKLRFALPDDVFNPEYKGLINFFHVLLYQIEAKEFLEVIGNAISEDSSKVSKAKKRFEEIVEEAKQMQEEFEDYKEDEDIDPDSNDDDDLDDFLNSLGITRPK